MNARELLQELISIPGPPGQERLVRDAIAAHVERLGLKWSADAKGNLIVKLGVGEPRLLVTAHMDEIAMMVRLVEPNGNLEVSALGGLFPWKLGEGPVSVLAPSGEIPGVLSFGSIHTEDPASNVRLADDASLSWRDVRVITGHTGEELSDCGVKPGTRVVVGLDRRRLTQLGALVAGYFLDDRADLVSWLLALKQLASDQPCVVFAATAAEEVGGEGALYLMRDLQPETCIALELGPNVPDAPVEISDQPSLWVNDGYSAMSFEDLELVTSVAEGLGIHLQHQNLSRGGSDASCAASHGLCARPVTLGLPMENSHGYEIMHPGAMENLARLTVELVRTLA